MLAQPPSPENCTIREESRTTVRVSCAESEYFDENTATYVLQVFDADTRRLLASATSLTPSMLEVTNLPAERSQSGLVLSLRIMTAQAMSDATVLHSLHFAREGNTQEHQRYPGRAQRYTMDRPYQPASLPARPLAPATLANPARRPVVVPTNVVDGTSLARGINGALVTAATSDKSSSLSSEPTRGSMCVGSFFAPLCVLCVFSCVCLRVRPLGRGCYARFAGWCRRVLTRDMISRPDDDACARDSVCSRVCIPYIHLFIPISTLVSYAV